MEQETKIINKNDNLDINVYIIGVIKTTKATAIASAVLVSSNAIAQDDLAIEEVIVTAQKKSENLQNVPISVTTLSSDELENLNIKDFADYVLQLPAASAVQRRPGQGQIFMRGISDGGNSNQSLQGPAVAICLDAVSYTHLTLPTTSPV